MDRRTRADALIRATRSLRDATLRASYVAGLTRAWPVGSLADALDLVCERAEQAEAAAREALLAVVDALNGEGMEPVVQRLREEAAARSLLALERLIRPPSRGHRSLAPSPSTDAGQPAAEAPRSNGRPLTLGERKWLARRPDRETMQKLLADPHPDVIRRCLTNPRFTEDDALRLAAKRPARSDVLAEVARSSWVRRPRVRMALVLNPATPPEIALRIAGLLLRPELELVARSPTVSASVRAMCLEHLERRPPSEGARGGHDVH